MGGNKFRSSDDVHMAQRRKVIQNMVPLAICKFPQCAPLASNISRKSHMIGWCNWARLIKRLTDRGVCRIEMGTGCLLTHLANQLGARCPAPQKGFSSYRPKIHFVCFPQLDTPSTPGVFVFTMKWGQACADLSLFV